MSRRLAAVFLLAAAATPAWAEDTGAVRLICRADAQQYAFAIDLNALKAVETGSGAQYGITMFRDGLGLWDQAAGRAQVEFRIDSASGRFAHMGQDGRRDGTCEVAEKAS